MNYSAEFKTVDLIVKSSAESRGVDAFALALIKAERQLRKLFTHLVFQFSCFDEGDINQLREILEKYNRVYFEGFERGFDNLFSHTIADLVGAEYSRLHLRIDEAIMYRNKIFHGQLTAKYLNREDLLGFVDDIRAWCKALAEGGGSHIGYDGFARNSFQKSMHPNLLQNFKVQFTSVKSYDEFIQQHMRRS